MAATASVAKSGDAYVDGLLSGIRWGTSTLTYSFPTSGAFYGAGYPNGENATGFSAFSAAQQAAVRSIVSSYSKIANVTFTEQTETSTAHATLRFASSNKPSTAWGYYPSTAEAGGDMWFNKSTGWYANPVKGNYAYLTMIHELGHAMGLKHPHEVSGVFGALPSNRDSLEYTVMSYRSYIGASTSTGYTNGSTSFPQSLMMLDIAALQKMYGANFTTNAGDTAYRWDPSTGQMSINGVSQGALAGNKVFLTVWDGGGNDTYDFSNYTTALKVDLNPGAWTTTSTTQLASLGAGRVAVGNIANALLYQGNTASLIENAVGGSAADAIVGNSAANSLTGRQGNDILDGGAGSDTAVYQGARASYTIAANSNGTWTVTDRNSGFNEGVDTLRNIEFAKFSDAVVQLTGTAPVTIPTPTSPPPPPPPPPPVAPSVTANAAPTVAGDVYSVAKGGFITVAAALGVLANDRDPEGSALKASLVSGPSSGTLSFKADGGFVYLAAAGYSGFATFSYQASDGINKSDVSIVTLKVGLVFGAGAGVGGGQGQHAAMADDQIPASAGTDSSGTTHIAGNQGYGTLVGSQGDDTYELGRHGARIIEAADGGHDLVIASTNHFLAANVEDLTLKGANLTGIGNALDNVLKASASGSILDGAGGNDTLIGREGADILRGSIGDDRLQGGGGNNVLTGGAGADRFIFLSDDFRTATTNTITDFSETQGDKIDLTQVDANRGTAGLDSFHFIGQAAFSGSAGELRYSVDKGGVSVAGDLNGDGVADFMLVLKGLAGLSAGAFDL